MSKIELSTYISVKFNIDPTEISNKGVYAWIFQGCIQC